jgi:hypothetical protein
MRKFLFVFLVTFLLVAFASVHEGNIPVVKAFLSVYQGDLILGDNDVYVIEGEFSINGSIIVEENATLVLRNAMVNFTQKYNNQFSMIFQNPANGNPRLLLENSTIYAGRYDLRIKLYGNSSATVNELIAETPEERVRLFASDFSVISVLDSNARYGHVIAFGNSSINVSNSLLFNVYGDYDSSVIVSNCSLFYVYAYRKSDVYVSNSTIDVAVKPFVDSANFSVKELDPRYVKYWSYQTNCSVSVASEGWSPNLVLTDTHVNGWAFGLHGTANATISDCKLHSLEVSYSSTLSVSNSAIGVLSFFVSSRGDFYNTTIQNLKLYADSKLWLLNSTYTTCTINHQSKIYVSWYLNAHVIDSIGQDVPSANVTATYPNTTMAESRLTDASGWARLTLMEKMMNATGEYPIGNYTVEAAYEPYSNSTTVNMTDNQMITLMLSDFVIPEFPSFLILFMIVTLLVAILPRKRLGNNNFA